MPWSEENYVPQIDECRYLILKIVEQAVRDYLTLENSKAPIDRVYFETAQGFLFDDDYRIQWGDMIVSFNDMLDFLDLDIDWFRGEAKILKARKEKEFEMKRMLKDEY